MPGPALLPKEDLGASSGARRLSGHDRCDIPSPDNLFGNLPRWGRTLAANDAAVKDWVSRLESKRGFPCAWKIGKKMAHGTCLKASLFVW